MLFFQGLVTQLYHLKIFLMLSVNKKKGRDLTQYYDKSPHRQKNPKNNVTTQKRHQKLRLHNDCGPTWVTITTQLVWLNQFTGSKPSHSPQQLCNRGNEHEGIILQLIENFNIYGLQILRY